MARGKREEKLAKKALCEEAAKKRGLEMDLMEEAVDF